MARTIQLGQVKLTKLRGYRWEVGVARDEEGKPYAKITEVYVVTDDDYTSVPEGQQRLAVELTARQQLALNNAFRSALVAATVRESVDEE